MHFLYSHLEFSPENLGEVSDKQSERFHQDIQAIERKVSKNLKGGYDGCFCWMLYRDDATHAYKRKSYANIFKSSS